MYYKLWNRKDKINNLEPSRFLNYPPFKNYDGDIILIYNDKGIVTQVESKEVLAQVYDIDINLKLDKFMEEYFDKKETIDSNV